jgi:hypothetical protein
VIPEGPFDRSTFNHLYRIIGDQMILRRRGVCPVFVSALRREKEYLSIGENQIWHFEEFFDTVRNACNCCDAEAGRAIREILLSVSEKLGLSPEQLQRRCF